MANLITLSRLLLLLVVVVQIYHLPAKWQFINVMLLIVMFITDGVDGHIARKRNEVSQFGAVFDIASDRIVELTMWIVFADLGLAPMWVVLVFIVRGVLVDSIRSTQASAHRRSPFSMMASASGRWLVAGKPMRILYAVVKAVTFCWLMLVFSLLPLETGVLAGHGELVDAVSSLLIYLCVALCVLRGLPVVAEFVYTERHSLLGSLSRPSQRPLI